MSNNSAIGRSQVDPSSVIDWNVFDTARLNKQSSQANDHVNALGGVMVTSEASINQWGRGGMTPRACPHRAHPANPVRG